MPSSQPPVTGGLSPGFVLKYLIGAVIVTGGLIASSIATGRTLANLVDTAQGVPACSAVAGPGCVASYPATAEQQLASSDSSNVTVVLHSSFLADTDQRDECFGAACIDYVPVAGDVAGRLRYPEPVRITAGDGRVMTITAPAGTITTQDAPGVSVLDIVADLIGGLYLVVLLALFAGGYVVLAIRTAIWRVHVVRWLRAVTALQVLTGVLSLAGFIGFAVGGSTGLVIVAVVLLAAFISAHVARLHARPPAMLPTSGPTPRERAFADRHWGPLLAACYVLAAFPVPLGVDVALRLLHDGYSTVAAVIAATVGLALAAFLVYRLDRSARPRRRSRHRIGPAVS